jgi:pilus assembly protein CpaF
MSIVAKLRHTQEDVPIQNGSILPESYFELKSRVHERLLDQIDLSVIETMDREILGKELIEIIGEILSEDSTYALNATERKRLFREVLDEVMGLGPIEPFLHDPSVADILVNSFEQVYVERYGQLEITDVRFKDDDHLRKIIDRIVSSVGRRIDESAPMVDARLQDGSRVNAIIPPLSIDGPALSIRRFAADPLEMDDLIQFKTLTTEIAEVLQGIVKARLNVLISGGTGSGKTTMLNVLSRFISNRERIVTIEDSAELQLKQDHVVRLETRPPNIEGKGEVTQRDLVKNSLRMRPDRIIVGEVRAQEAFDMLQAMNTGHDGSLTTIHANAPRDALYRLEILLAMAGMQIEPEFLRHYIASAIDVVVHVARLADGSRKLTSLQEITGMEGDLITMQELFSFRQTGISEDGKVEGKFVFHGVRPKFAERFEIAGVDLRSGLFDTFKRERR